MWKLKKNTNEITKKKTALNILSGDACVILCKVFLACMLHSNKGVVGSVEWTWETSLAGN